MNNYNWLVIGASNIAREYMIDAILANSSSTIKYLVTGSPNLADDFSRKFDIGSTTSSLDEAMDNKINVAYVSGYNKSRYENVKFCLQNNIHVLSEKPLSLSSTEAAELCDLADKNNLVLAVNHHLPCSAVHQKSKELLNTGMIGELLSIRIFHSVCLPESLAGWRINDPLEGGVLWDIAIHNIDLMHYLTDDQIIECKTFTDTHVENLPETQAMSIYKLSNGALAYSHEGYNTAFPYLGTQLLGTKGSICTEDSMSQDPAGSVYSITEKGRAEYDVDNSNLYRTSVETFLKTIDGEGHAISSGRHAINNIKCIEMIHKNLKE